MGHDHCLISIHSHLSTPHHPLCSQWDIHLKKEMLYKKVYENGEGLRSAQLHRKRLDAMQNACPSSLEIWASKLPMAFLMCSMVPKMVPKFAT